MFVGGGDSPTLARKSRVGKGLRSARAGVGAAWADCSIKQGGQGGLIRRWCSQQPVERKLAE